MGIKFFKIRIDLTSSKKKYFFFIGVESKLSQLFYILKMRFLTKVFTGCKTNGFSC